MRDLNWFSTFFRLDTQYFHFMPMHPLSLPSLSLSISQVSLPPTHVSARLGFIDSTCRARRNNTERRALCALDGEVMLARSSAIQCVWYRARRGYGLWMTWERGQRACAAWEMARNFTIQSTCRVDTGELSRPHTNPPSPVIPLDATYALAPSATA